MNLVLKILNLLSLLIGLLGAYLTYKSINADTEFLLFMDIQIILILIPSVSLIIGAILFFLFIYLQSKLRFLIITLITLSAAGVHFYFFFKELYGYLGRTLLSFELILLIALYFYLNAFLNFFIKTNKQSVI